MEVLDHTSQNSRKAQSSFLKLGLFNILKIHDRDYPMVKILILMFLLFIHKVKQYSKYSFFVLDQQTSMQGLLKIGVSSLEYFEIESRTGLTGQKINWIFPCFSNQVSKSFFVLLREGVTIDKITRSTYLNLVRFAQKRTNARTLVFIMPR